MVKPLRKKEAMVVSELIIEEVIKLYDLRYRRENRYDFDAISSRLLKMGFDCRFVEGLIAMFHVKFAPPLGDEREKNIVHYLHDTTFPDAWEDLIESRFPKSNTSKPEACKKEKILPYRPPIEEQRKELFKI